MRTKHIAVTSGGASVSGGLSVSGDLANPGIALKAGAVNNLGALLAFTHLPMAEAFALIFLMPIFVTLLSVVVLREHVGWRRWLAVVAGFAGVLVVLRPGFRELHIGHLGGIICGLAGACGVVLMRRVGDREHRLGSPPFSRTLTRRPIKAMRSVHVEAKEVQHRVQARCG